MQVKSFSRKLEHRTEEKKNPNQNKKILEQSPSQYQPRKKQSTHNTLKCVCVCVWEGLHNTNII